MNYFSKISQLVIDIWHQIRANFLQQLSQCKCACAICWIVIVHNVIGDWLHAWAFLAQQRLSASWCVSANKKIKKPRCLQISLTPFELIARLSEKHHLIAFIIQPIHAYKLIYFTFVRQVCTSTWWAKESFECRVVAMNASTTRRITSISGCDCSENPVSCGLLMPPPAAFLLFYNSLP